MINVGIHGIGIFVPEQIISNQDLEQRLDTSDEWIRTRTGIRERRFAGDDVRTSDMGAQAALNALQQANLQPQDIDMIIVATATPDHNFPSVACQIQGILGIPPGVAAFDVSVACSGFIYAMVTAYQFISTGTYQRVLVIGAEKFSNIMDHDDRNTAVLFGDGAGAVVLGPVSDGHGILSFDLGADGTGAKHLLTDPHVIMNGREVFKFAVRQLPISAEKVLEKAGLKKEDVDFLIPHQANIRIIEAARDRLGLSPDKVSITLDQYGNTSAASIPLSLAHEIENGRIHDGDVLVMVGFGGGLTWGALCMRWGK